MKSCQRLLFTAATLALTELSSTAQISWVDLANPNSDQAWTIEGRIHSEAGYGRLPANAKATVRPAVWNLGAQSAGLTIRFWSNSPDIHLQYQLTGSLAMPHMPATGVSGFDLYRRTSEGKQHWVAALKPSKTAATVKLAGGLSSHPRVPALYTLYLPLYNGVKSLKIGVPKGKTLSPAKPNSLKPIVVYGTSIAQGACASRPGLAWTNILSRGLDWPVINLGFSGNGTMEPAVADLFLKTDAAVYVIDCLPNMNTHAVKKRIAPLLDQIRKARPSTPILLVEQAPRDNAIWHPAGQKQLTAECAALRAEFDKRKATDRNLHYLRGDQLLGDDGAATVDAVHPNDIGMMRHADAYENTLRPILGMSRKHATAGIATIPQLREIPGYNFMLRHQQILARNKTTQPDIVWLGDSIIHFFGGEPKAHLARGQASWDKLFANQKVTNLAYGWDRTENVLWRIQHGELDGISPKTILLSIGTNDLSIGRTPAQVSDSIISLTKEIKSRHPNAKLIVTGILPRRGHHQQRIKTNNLLEKRSASAGFTYLDLDKTFPTTNKNGKPTIRGMCPDQLHPNSEGYKHLSDTISNHLDKLMKR
ncbi:MAG: SGNH/GDSL hydrolase family protein [Akkermansiaceae bacterium]